MLPYILSRVRAGGGGVHGLHGDREEIGLVWLVRNVLHGYEYEDDDDQQEQQQEQQQQQ